MFVFFFVAPAFLVVVLGYVAGYAVSGVVGSPSELTGWTTGLVTLLVVARLALRAWRRRGGRGGHQK